MRQAGHGIPEYDEMRKKYDILTIARTPELCARVSLLPITTYGVDAAVMYTDIILPLQAMGLNATLDPKIGPLVANPIRTMQDVEALREPEALEGTPFVMEAIRIVHNELAGQKAVIAISGGLFTLALYCIEGRPSRDYAFTKSLMYEHPEVWHAFMQKLTTVISRYVVAEAEAGATAVQIFDTNVGFLGPSAYRTFVQPYTRALFDALRQTGVPGIHFGTSTTGLLEVMAETGGDVMGIDWRFDLDDAWAKLDYKHAIMGNLDPTLLLAPWEIVEAEMHDVLRRAAGRPGHIFNLGHAIHPASNPDHLRRLVDAVHEQTAQAR
jgi:uroporphyrinogen decarboxylase